MHVQLHLILLLTCLFAQWFTVLYKYEHVSTSQAVEGLNKSDINRGSFVFGRCFPAAAGTVPTATNKHSRCSNYVTASSRWGHWAGRDSDATAGTEGEATELGFSEQSDLSHTWCHFHLRSLLVKLVQLVCGWLTGNTKKGNITSPQPGEADGQPAWARFCWRCLPPLWCFIDLCRAGTSLRVSSHCCERLNIITK